MIIIVAHQKWRLIVPLELLSPLLWLFFHPLLLYSSHLCWPWYIFRDYQETQVKLFCKSWNKPQDSLPLCFQRTLERIRIMPEKAQELWNSPNMKSVNYCRKPNNKTGLMSKYNTVKVHSGVPKQAAVPTRTGINIL